jgi:hypothetical protein
MQCPDNFTADYAHFFHNTLDARRHGSGAHRPQQERYAERGVTRTGLHFANSVSATEHVGEAARDRWLNLAFQRAAR